MKKSVKIQFYGLIFLKQRHKFIPAIKSGVNSLIPIRQGIKYDSGVSFKTFSASFYDCPGNPVRKAFLLPFGNTISFAILSFHSRQKLAAFNAGNLTAKRLLIPSYG